MPNLIAVHLDFDGQDLVDLPPPADDVATYSLVICRACGSAGDARYPVCCEFAVEAALELREPVAAGR
jgi:hypothetical protein